MHLRKSGRCSYQRRPSRRATLLEGHRAPHRCSRYHEGTRRLGDRPLRLSCIGQHDGGNTTRIINRLAELTFWIDDNPALATKWPPTRGKVVLEFEPFETWFDNPLHYILTGPEQVDQSIIFTLLQDVQNESGYIARFLRETDPASWDYPCASRERPSTPAGSLGDGTHQQGLRRNTSTPRRLWSAQTGAMFRCTRSRSARSRLSMWGSSLKSGTACRHD
jgi:hypothetical protein